MSENELLLMHLSDIHFHKQSGGPFDLDEDLRISLETDASEFVSDIGRGVDGIVITGDVAYSGQKSEYEKAENWLTSLCEKVGCLEENVWTVPGNHDVDRSLIDNSPLIKALHKDLRFKELRDIDGGIKEFYYDDKTAAASLHSPLKNYMGFNKLYGGSVKRDGSLYWEYDLPLNDGGILRLRGLNSTLVSNALDDEGNNKMILGLKQVQLPKDDNRIAYLTLCHHPLDWIKDNIESHLNSRAILQLFGHKHNQCVQQIDNSLRIVAGATHPDRADSDWLPRYNFLSLSVVKENGNRKLHVNVYSRLWSADETKFKPDFVSEGKIFKDYDFDLPDWDGISKDSDVSTKKESEDMATIKSINKESKIENPYRKLVYRFYKLAFNVRHQIVLKLKLIRDEDEGLEEIDLFKNIFLRAKQDNILDKVWEETEKAHENYDNSNNPFKEV